MQANIADMLQQAQADAADVVVRHKKKASLALYKVLASCLAIVERVAVNSDDRAQMVLALHSIPLGNRNRTFIEKGSDDNQLVCRYVFQGSNFTNICRYAHCLREAAKLQVNSENLADYMKKNGGVNALYFRRPIEARVVRTKALRLTKTIEYDRDKPFTITLQWTLENAFDVLDITINDA